MPLCSSRPSVRACEQRHTGRNPNDHFINSGVHRPSVRMKSIPVRQWPVCFSLPAKTARAGHASALLKFFKKLGILFSEKKAIG